MRCWDAALAEEVCGRLTRAAVQLAAGWAVHITFLYASAPSQCCSLIKWNGAITGGSIFLSGDSSLLLSDVLLVNNTARRGGAVAAERASLLLLNHSTLIFNSASSGGAAVAASDQVAPSISSYRYRGVSFASIPLSQLHNQLSVSSFCPNPFCLLAGCRVCLFLRNFLESRPHRRPSAPPRIFQLISRPIAYFLLTHIIHAYTLQHHSSDQSALAGCQRRHCHCIFQQLHYHGAPRLVC